MSRPSSYKKRYASEASRMCLIGATDQILAEHFHVTTQTIRNWKVSHPEFLEAINEAKEKADSLVQKSLFKRATGYKTTQIRTLSDEDGRQVKVEKITKDVAPDPRASRLWLRNRQPGEWRDSNNALLEQQANQLQQLQQQAAQDEQYIQKLESQLERLQDKWDKLRVSLRAQQEAIGEDLLDQIFDVMLEIREEEDGMVNYTLDVRRFKASLLSPLAHHEPALYESRELETNNFNSSEALRTSPTHMKYRPAAQCAEEWRCRAIELQRKPSSLNLFS